MKKSVTIYLTLIVALFLGVHAEAQAPQAIPYQAVVRNNAGNIIANKTIGLQFEIRNSSATGTLLYQETQTATTNALGLFSANVGQGTATGVSPTPFTYINWQSSSKFLVVKVDTTGGTTYVTIGSQQLLSVPYALSSYDGVPVGTVVSYMGNTSTLPPGWLLCDGSAYNQFTYKNLFAVIGRIYGNGNGTTTFNIPDLRGMFLRGVSGSSGNDPDTSSRAVPANSTGGKATGVGSIQADAFKIHKHDANMKLEAEPINGGARAAHATGATGKVSPTWTTTDLVMNNGESTETRPKNVYVNYIIKY